MEWQVEDRLNGLDRLRIKDFENRNETVAAYMFIEFINGMLLRLL